VKAPGRFKKKSAETLDRVRGIDRCQLKMVTRLARRLLLGQYFIGSGENFPWPREIQNSRFPRTKQPDFNWPVCSVTSPFLASFSLFHNASVSNIATLSGKTAIADTLRAVRAIHLLSTTGC
jgi:hypothetical protein